MAIESQGNVQRHLAAMIIMERHIQEVLGQSQEQATGHDEIAVAIKRFQAIAKEQREALEDRLQILRASSDAPAVREDGDASDVLCRLYGAFSEAALGYAILRALAHRSFDRKGEGNTRDLAEKHSKTCSQAVHDIQQLISGAVIAELDSSGDECRCQCTTCALGICTCAPMGIGRANKDWLDTVSAGTPGNILVTAPRKGSAAARAGLRSGDVILAADGLETPGNQDLHAAIRKHQAGETVQLKVRRASGRVDDITLIC